MGIQNELNVICTTRKTLLHLTMLTSIVAAAALTTGVAGQDASSSSSPTASSAHLDNRIQELPFCGDGHERNIGRRLLYISTLDGRLSALDIAKGGKRRWSIPTGPGPLISSSIHRLELTSNGQFVRMIPSLSGGIYKFDGESIDPIPINAEHLLSSSTKFSDDLVISGGKETRTYGVSTRTGQLLYECSMHGCMNATDDAINNTKPIAPDVDDDEEAEEDKANGDGDGYLKKHDPLVDDIIVVRRQTQTVRAVESRTGLERWNFSVGQHDLEFIRPSDCHDVPYSELDMAVLDLDVKVIVPEGLICAFSRSEPGAMLWKHKFDHPIVSAWKVGPTDELESIDMFGSAQWHFDQDSNIFEPLYPTISPSIYLGMYDKQLYIQESVNIRKEIMDQTNLYNQLTTNDIKLPRIPWRPIAANSNSMILAQNDRVIGGTTQRPRIEDENLQGNELMPYDEENFAISAQSVLNASEYVNGNGFYLYTRDDLNKPDRSLCDSDETNNNNNNIKDKENLNQNQFEKNATITDDMNFNLDDLDAPVKVVILSLWFWWKEIVVIAFTSAILLNLFINQRQRPEREIVVIERHIPVPTAMEATESSTAALLGPPTNGSKSTSNGFSFGQRSLSESTSHSSETFSSRFQGDFDLMQCLGRGGFGVVFEAKNKLDDCKYAVKRITLPNKKESRDRVMREVKTLANCEHQNIVRYFQAWVETPPPGWQEEEDSKWLAHEMSTSIQIETPDGTTLPSFASNAVSEAARKKLQLDKKKQLLSWVSSVTSTACSNDPKDFDLEDDDDSCIIFATESQSLAMKDESTGERSIQKLKNGHNSSISNGISIDIHSNSFDMGLQNGKNLDYSQLSDSFQIEFVRSTSGVHSELDNTHEDDDKDDHDKNNSVMSISRNKRQQLSLDISPEHNNNCKALMLAKQNNTPPDKPIKPIQNKVFLYIQMQLCRKESLRDWLRDNRTEGRAQHIPSIFHQIVDAVDYVHLKGLIHRDLKPSNIFFSQDGQIKIGDFGLVTDMSDIPNMVTKCGDSSGLPSCLRHTQQVGTHLYMSPEQLRGQPYDYKVDIYSLGLIFFELLVYFNTEMERILTLRDLRDEKYPKDFPTKHPAEYELLKCMLSAQPQERPSTMELKQKLNGILNLPENIANDSETANAIAEALRRLSRSRTFSSSIE